ncbi:MAG: zinc ribbon domain-containing protein [Deltaproteobacteria bacterium]|nr:zinc ribbon domain-containing protein [Deltaproteobacteria bacterium]MBW1922658.1 zinc ribbon domain-containing protein [Deltaproteobacteria bacterium]MBW1948729.1 zinc ribbon domain-containing protein [Deltaproteobacteria bacterium]MBW2007629.1 zinc ribbon domain-containing protein [Deltaproteobacteria bacterium]MBW2103446.1 zinc ribbon domain-containing protein [Deltaproteobacteria bacterium]
MPIYEFQCAKCGHQIEVWMKFSDKPPARCELCSGKMKKLISQSTFHLKGTGWYVTDYASKSGGSGSKADSSRKSETKAETKTKSEPKKEAKGKD